MGRSEHQRDMDKEGEVFTGYLFEINVENKLFYIKKIIFAVEKFSKSY